MKIFLLAAISLSLPAFLRAAERELPSTASESLSAHVSAILDSTHIPDTEIKNENLRDILDWFRTFPKKRGPKDGISYIVRFDPKASDPSSISFSLSKDSLRSALNKICNASDLYWWISSQAIVISPKSDYKAQQDAAANP